MDLMSLLRRHFLHYVAGASLLPAAHTFAQSYPARPVRIVVDFGAGTGLDLYARLIGQSGEAPRILPRGDLMQAELMPLCGNQEVRCR
jgi:tripartite-type tricarboxylate transporter receptor subunit TctC